MNNSIPTEIVDTILAELSCHKKENQPQVMAKLNQSPVLTMEWHRIIEVENKFMENV